MAFVVCVVLLLVFPVKANVLFHRKIFIIHDV